MDRRQKKTRAAIFDAFSKLLETKRFEHITVQEIIDTANIGRSTFYAHFQTKDDLLRTMCTDIFQHVFSVNLPQTEDGGSQGISELEGKLGHILYHLKGSKKEVKRILCSESGDLFMAYLKEYLFELFQCYIDAFTFDVPEEFMLHHLVGSCAEAIKWWSASNMEQDPYQIARYFISVVT